MNPASITLALAMLAIAAILGCRTAEVAGSYPAANPRDCLPDIALVDQRGNHVSLASLKGTPVLIDFIYTSCASTCPMLTAKMVEVARTLGTELGVQVKMVSITLDPEHDGPAELRKYSERQGANDRGWLFLTGTPLQIDSVLARFNLVRSRGPDGSVTHTISAFLLGPDGHQVRQYNALDVSAKSVAADVDQVLGRG